jgi:hypothetical protein
VDDSTVARAVEEIRGASIVFGIVLVLGPVWSFVVTFAGWGFRRGLWVRLSGVSFSSALCRTFSHCGARDVVDRGARHLVRSHDATGRRSGDVASAGFRVDDY